MSNVTAIFNATIKGEPDAMIVELLERLLDEAKRGEISGIAVASAVPNGDTRNSWAHVAGAGHQLSTGIMILARDYANAWVCNCD